MARTLNPVAHAVRRDAFVEVALRLITARGYDQVSIQDVLDEIGASKGAFFHYFDSKAALLTAAVDRMVEMAASAAMPAVDDPSLTALQKLRGVFTGIYQWKSGQPEFQRAVLEESMRTWFSDENIIVRERMRAAVGERLTPVLARILHEGVADGSFVLASPDGAASVVTSLILGLNEVATRLFLGRLDGTVAFETVTRTLRSYLEALERILCVPAGSLEYLDEDAIRAWFDNPNPERSVP